MLRPSAKRLLGMDDARKSMVSDGRSTAGWRSDDGAGAVEFAIVAALLMLLVLGAVEFGRMMWTYASVETASREAARYGTAVGPSDGGVPRYSDCDEIRNAGRLLSGIALDNGDFLVQYDNGPGTSSFQDCPAGSNIDPTTIASGDRILVQVTTSFDSLLPFVDLDRTITSTDRRTIIKP
jgi:Flp pilus assembly protein TadG